jgi:GT2 family glycosyltransferase
VSDKNYLVLMNGFFEKLLVVLVIYKMRIKDSPSYHSLTNALVASGKSASIFIYDNSPESQNPPADSNWSIHYVNDQTNAGVSKAYNEGFKKARMENKKWLLLVDQDTVFPKHTFLEYEMCALQSKSNIVVPVLLDQIGIVSPFKFRFGGGRRLSHINKTTHLSLKDFFFVNSGVLVSVECFEKVDGYDEQFRLDFSDIDFILRLRKIEKVFVLATINCQHHLAGIGNNQEDSLFRFTEYVKSSSALQKKYDNLFWLRFRVFIRAVKFSWRFRTFRFMIEYVK